ncbi:hypothetical protein Bbelb_270020 [Branchiostoma belcheri]|nr:hypothetical protein Bbelb_270020 [Branchiostoma belcheri]
MPSAECHTDHRLVRCKLTLHFKPKPKRGGPPRKKLHVGRLESDVVKADLQSHLQSKLESSEEVLGFSGRKSKDWFDKNDQEIQQLLAKKRAAHQAHLAQPSCPAKKAAFRSTCSKLQRSLRIMQNTWWTHLAETTQLCANIGDYRGFYEALKAVYGPTHQVVAPLRSTDGQTLLTDKKSGSMEAQHCTPNSMNSLCAAGNRESFPRTSETLSSSPFTRTKGKSKILARLLNRLVPAVAEHHLPESQQGYYRHASWSLLGSWVIQLHEDQRGQVRSRNDLSEHFPVLNGVKQGCVLAPTLFTIFFSMMLQQATEDLGDEDGIYIRYRTDGSLFNLRCLQAHTKTLEQLIRELLFADAAALVAHTEFAMQRVTSCFAEASELFGLEVSLKKTEVLHQPARRKEYCPPCIKIGEKPLKAVHQFTYLGSTITSDAKIDKEVDNRLAKANSAFGRLHSRVWKSKHLKKDTKISVYKAVALTTLPYGSESWVTYRHHLRLLERFHQRCLHSILNIHWSDYVTNVEEASSSLQGQKGKFH